MDVIILLLIVGNIYSIVYFRLMMHADQGSGRPPGLALVLSMPSRKGLSATGLKYWRRYWIACFALLSIGAAALVWRYPYIAAQLRAVG